MPELSILSPERQYSVQIPARHLSKTTNSSAKADNDEHAACTEIVAVRSSDDRMWSYDYNSNTWAEVIDSGTPPLLDYTRMAYLPELQQSILFGGVDVPKEVPQGNTWLYDHATKQWQQLSLTNAPEARGFYGMVYEPTSKQVLLFGGGTDRNRAYGDLWRFDPLAQSWTEITPADAPQSAVAPAEVGFFLTGADRRSILLRPALCSYSIRGNRTHRWYIPARFLTYGGTHGQG